MNQKKLKLEPDLESELKKCDEVWIAVALMTDYGYDFLKRNTNDDVIQHYLLGVDLPTTPYVLKNLLNESTKPTINPRLLYKANSTYHPKCYLLRNEDEYVVFIGSGNCTKGGLSKNLEMSVKSTDQALCADIKSWFEKLFNMGMDLSNEFVDSYSDIYEARKARRIKDEEDLGSIMSSDPSVLDLDALDFKDHFFELEHFKAFIGSKPWKVDDATDAERYGVRQRLFDLNDIVSPMIKAKGWDLHEHYVYDDIVSSYKHGQYTSDQLDSVWLHYGRSKSEIKKIGAETTPLDYMRLQVIVLADGVGLWNRVGKDKGSRVDREFIKTSLETDEDYRTRFYNAVSNLPVDYFLVIGGERRLVKDFKSQEDLIEFVLQDKPHYYFIIGIHIPPDDPRLSRSNIANTIIEHFAHLYSTYDVMRYRMNL